MEKAQHTPGPYRVTHISTEEAPNNLVHTFQLFTSPDVPHDNRMGKATADLFAAAPETAAKLEQELFMHRATVRDRNLIESERDRLKEALEGLIYSVEHEGEVHGRIVDGIANARAVLNGESTPAETESTGGIPLPKDYVDFSKLKIVDPELQETMTELLEALDNAYNTEMDRKDEARNFENSTLKNWKKIIQQARKLV